MKTILPLLLAFVTWSQVASAERSDFEFVVSGSLVKKLEPGTRVVIWSPVTKTKPNWVNFTVEQAPITVPFEQLAEGHIWVVDFLSPTLRRRIFSMALSPDLFDKPRRITLKVDCPQPRLRPRHLGGLEFQYYAGITQRMWYLELPFWDKQQKKIVAAKPPVMRVFFLPGDLLAQESKMEVGCMGSRWWGKLDRSLDLGEGADLRFTVRYDSGGLWDPIDTTLDFAYRKKLHGHFR